VRGRRSWSVGAWSVGARSVAAGSVGAWGVRGLRYGRLGICATFEVLDLLVVFAGEGFDLSCWDLTESAAEEYLFEGVMLPGEVSKLLCGFGVDGFEGALAVLGDAGVKFGFGFSAPGDKGRFGDAEPACDSGKAQACDTEAKKFVTGGGRVHGDGV
jgi:hypothetical protein